jgi:hypothetical protein
VQAQKRLAQDSSIAPFQAVLGPSLTECKGCRGCMECVGFGARIPHSVHQVGADIVDVPLLGPIAPSPSEIRAVMMVVLRGRPRDCAHRGLRRNLRIDLASDKATVGSGGRNHGLPNSRMPWSRREAHRKAPPGLPTAACFRSRWRRSPKGKDDRIFDRPSPEHPTSSLPLATRNIAAQIPPRRPGRTRCPQGPCLGATKRL